MNSVPNSSARAMTKAQAQAWPARRLPAEWEPAGAVLLAWPRADGDWAPYLEDVRACYRRLLAALSALAPVLLLVDEPERVLLELGPELAALTRQPFSPPGPASANGSGAGGAAASGPSTTGSASGEPITGALAAPRLRLLASPARDTWTRDYGPITVLERQLERPTTATGARTTATTAAMTPAVARPGSRKEQPLLLDFSFNGWGGKYASAGDDAATTALHASGALGPVPLERHALVLEGGSIESDGLGTLLTTSTCLLAPSRNPQLDPSTLEAELKRLLGVERVLWLEQEALAGDDTDAHIDTLVRFCPNDTLVYVQGEPIAPLAHSAARERDAGSHSGAPGGSGERRTPAAHPRDGHGQPGAAPPESLLERQLRALRTAGGQPYRLVALPPGPPRHAPDDGRPLPATYANALFLNGSVLLPVYGDPERDADAVAAWRQACPEWRIQAIDCSALLLQHGSLHCATMQIPAAVFG
jgi:agmatine/peptidylarginine deiminase